MNIFKSYGFRPSEEELIGYLRNRTFLGPDYLGQDITDLGADICNWMPWDLPGCARVMSSDPTWYFTYPITYKHSNNNSKMTGMVTGEGPGLKQKPKAINRATNGGKWKVSGERLKVRASDSKEIGIKTRLYFYSSGANHENEKKSKAKGQNSYQNKTPWVLYVYALIDVEPSKNKYYLGKLMLKQSESTNNSSSKGETSQQFPSNYLQNDHIPTPEVHLDIHQEPLVETEVSHDYDWIQSQSSKQTNEFINSFPATYPEERSNQENFVYDGNEVISNLKPSNLENYVADYADIPQVDYVKLVTNPEDLSTNQQDHSFENVLVDNGETYHDERSNQHNIVAEHEGFSLPDNFSNYPIPDISPMNSFGFDDSYWDGEASDNNSDGVQNQSSINQQAADEFRNGNFINEIAYSDERNKSAAAEIEGSNFPSLSMESFRKRTGMELEGSSTDIETEVAQAQAKKNRF